MVSPLDMVYKYDRRPGIQPVSNARAPTARRTVNDCCIDRNDCCECFPAGQPVSDSQVLSGLSAAGNV